MLNKLDRNLFSFLLLKRPEINENGTLKFLEIYLNSAILLVKRIPLEI